MVANGPIPPSTPSTPKMVPGPRKGTVGGTPGLQDGSLAAVFILSAPFALGKVCIFSFLIGLVIYQDFVLIKKLEDDAVPGDSRDSFITLIVETGMCNSFFLFTLSAKDIETLYVRGPLGSRNLRSTRWI